MPADRTSRTQRFLRGTARWLAVCAVIMATWLFGAAEPWAYLLVSALVYVAAMFWLFAVVCAPRPGFRMGGMTLLLLGLMLLTGLQAVPLPERIVAVLNPYAAGMIQDGNVAWRALATLPGTAPPALPYTLSVSPSATWRSFGLLVAYGMTFLVVLNCARHWRHVATLVAAVVVSGFFLALVGLIHKFSGSDELLWIQLPRHGGNIFGPFTNRNHYAANMNMVLGLALGMFLASPPISEMVAWRDWRERLQWLSSRTASRLALTAFAVVLMGGAMCATLSRGGVVSLATGLMLVGLAIVMQGGVSRRARRSLLLLALLVFVSMLWLTGSALFDRMGTLSATMRDPMQDERAIVTADTLRLFWRYPLTGSGFGTFRHVFSTVQSPALKYRWLHAHNDWAQLFAEGGVVGGVLFLCLVALVLRYVGLRFQELTDRSRLFVLGAGVGLCTIMVHSLVDYSLHKPANAFLLSLLAAVTLAAVHLRSRQKPAPRAHPILRAMGVARPPRRHRVGDGRWQRNLARGAALAGMLGLSALLMLQWQSWRGEMAFARFLHLRRMARKAGPEQTAAIVSGACMEADIVALRANRNPDALAEITAVLLRWTFDDALSRAQRSGLAERAVTYARIAVRGAPSDYLAWLSLARTCFALGMWDEAETALKRARNLVIHSRQVRMFLPPPPDAGGGDFD